MLANQHHARLLKPLISAYHGLTGIGRGECADETDSIPDRVVATGMRAYSPPPTSFVDAAITSNEEAVSDVTPSLRTNLLLGEWHMHAHTVLYIYIVVHVSILNRFHPSNARGLGRALRCHGMVREKVAHLEDALQQEVIRVK